MTTAQRKTVLSLPMVSVLVPSYNSRRYLGECLESALGQTYPNIEIIVVDDASTDGSLELAHSLADRGVHVIEARENGGQSRALNLAFDASRGEYLQYLDADDVLHPRKIETQLARLQSAPPTAMASGAWARFRSDPSEAVFGPEAVWRDLSPIDWLVASWTGGGMMHVAGWLIPRPVVLAAGPWPEALRWAANLDAHFFTRALLTSSMCLFCPEAKSYYRSGHASMSSWRSRRNLEATFEVLTGTGQALLRCEDSVRTRMAFADNLQRFVYSTYPESRDLVARAEQRIDALGGSTLRPTGGPAFELASKLLGWRLARRLRLLAGGVVARFRGRRS